MANEHNPWLTFYPAQQVARPCALAPLSEGGSAELLKKSLSYLHIIAKVQDCSISKQGKELTSSKGDANTDLVALYGRSIASNAQAVTNVN